MYISKQYTFLKTLKVWRRKTIGILHKMLHTLYIFCI